MSRPTSVRMLTVWSVVGLAMLVAIVGQYASFLLDHREPFVSVAFKLVGAAIAFFEAFMSDKSHGLDKRHRAVWFAVLVAFGIIGQSIGYVGLIIFAPAMTMWSAFRHQKSAE